jgi:hypothetical protein
MPPTPPVVKRAKEGNVKDDPSYPPFVRRTIQEAQNNKDAVDPQGTNIKAKKIKK